MNLWRSIGVCWVSVRAFRRSTLTGSIEGCRVEIQEVAHLSLIIIGSWIDLCAFRDVFLSLLSDHQRVSVFIICMIVHPCQIKHSAPCLVKSASNLLNWLTDLFHMHWIKPSHLIPCSSRISYCRLMVRGLTLLSAWRVGRWHAETLGSAFWKQYILDISYTTIWDGYAGGTTKFLPTQPQALTFWNAGFYSDNMIGNNNDGQPYIWTVRLVPKRTSRDVNGWWCGGAKLDSNQA